MFAAVGLRLLILAPLSTQRRRRRQARHSRSGIKSSVNPIATLNSVSRTLSISLVVILFAINAQSNLRQRLLVEARGGGSKRTFGSPKSQSSQGPNLADCSDQNVCQTEQSDSSWTSALAATMALVGPLCVLLTLIAMIKFCFVRAYSKGQLQLHLQVASGSFDGDQSQIIEVGQPSLAETEAALTTICQTREISIELGERDQLAPIGPKSADLRGDNR